MSPTPRTGIEDWRIDYNQNRPTHSAHGDDTPTEFAQAWTTQHLNGEPHMHLRAGGQGE